MRPTLLAIAIALAALALVPAAAAKPGHGEMELTLCGPGACAKLHDRELAEAIGRALWPGTGSDEPAPLGRYYEIAELGRAYYVPGAGALRMVAGPGGATWLRLPAGVARRLDAWAARSVDPYGWPELVRVYAGTREARDPGAYVGLYEPFPAAAPPPPSARRVSIALRTDRPTPWSDGANMLKFVPGRNLLLRDGQWVRIPDGLAGTLATDAGLAPAGPRPEPGFPWAFVVGAAAGTLGLLVAALALAVRVKRRPRAAAPA